MCILFLLLTGATWYHHAIYIVFTYFASFTGYEGDISEVISNLHVQGSKFGRKFDKFGGKSFLKIELCRVNKVCFFQVCHPPPPCRRRRRNCRCHRKTGYLTKNRPPSYDMYVLISDNCLTIWSLLSIFKRSSSPPSRYCLPWPILLSHTEQGIINV